MIVLLIFFMKNVNLSGYEYRVIELFAGVARVAKVACLRGYRAVALDISFHSVGKTFDVTSASGYVFLTCTRPTTFRGFQLSGVYNYAVYTVCCAGPSMFKQGFTSWLYYVGSLGKCLP